MPLLNNEHMLDGFRHWLAEALDRQHMTQQALARASGVNQSVISKLLAGKRSRPSHATVSRIIEALGAMENARLAAWLLYGDTPADTVSIEFDSSSVTAPLVGSLGAEGLYYADPHAGPWNRSSDVSIKLGQGTVALQVHGDFMAPVYRDGDLLFFRPRSLGRPLRDLVGFDCMVQTKGSVLSATLRHVRHSESGYILESYAAGVDPVVVDDVEWASPIEAIQRKCPEFRQQYFHLSLDP